MENTENYAQPVGEIITNVMKPMSLTQILKHLVLHGIMPRSIGEALKTLPNPHDELRWLVINNVHKDTDKPFFDDDDGAKQNLACLVALTRAIIFDSQALRRKALLAPSPPLNAPPLPKSEAELRTLGFSDWEIEDYCTTLENKVDF